MPSSCNISFILDFQFACNSMAKFEGECEGGERGGVWLNFSADWQLKHLDALCVLIMIGRCRLGRYGLKAAAMFQQMLDTQTVLGSANYNYNTTTTAVPSENSTVPSTAVWPRGATLGWGFFFFWVLCIFNVCLLSLCRSLLFFSLSTSHCLPFPLSVYLCLSAPLSVCRLYCLLGRVAAMLTLVV